MKKKRVLPGIMISARSFETIEGTKKKNVVEISSYNQHSFPDETLPLEKKISYAIGKWHSAGKNDLALLLPPDATVTQLVRLPNLPRLKLEKLIYYEFSKHTPYTPDQVAYDFEVFSSPSSDNSEDVSILLYFIQSDLYESIKTSMDEYGISNYRVIPRECGMTSTLGFMQNRLVPFITMDISGGHTIFYLFEESPPVPRRRRQIDTGTGELINACMKIRKIERDESIKYLKNPAALNNSELTGHPMFSKLLRRYEECLQFLDPESRCEIILMNDNIDMHELYKRKCHKFGSMVDTDKIKSDVSVDGTLIGSVLNSYRKSPVGLSVHTPPADKPAPSVYEKISRPVLKIASIVLMVFFGLNLLWLIPSYKKYVQEKKIFRHENKKYTDDIKKYELLFSGLKSNYNKLQDDFHNTYIPPHTDFLEKFVNIIKDYPSLKLTEFSLKSQSRTLENKEGYPDLSDETTVGGINYYDEIRLKGTAKNVTNVLECIERLKKDESIRNIRLDKTLSGDDNKLIFNIYLYYRYI